MTAAETERVRRIQDRTAPSYDRRMSPWERVLFRDGGMGLLAGRRRRARGCGWDRAKPAFYGRSVRLTGIELSPEMLAVASRFARRLGSEVDLRLGDAQDLDFAAGSFDTVVITLALCTIPDDRLAVREAHRVLRPGGRLFLLEHVRSPFLPVRLAQRLLEPLAARFEADYLLRDPLDYLEVEGFLVERAERSKWGIVERVVARKSG